MKQKKRYLDTRYKIAFSNIFLISSIVALLFVFLKGWSSPKLTGVSLITIMALGCLLLIHFFNLILQPLRKLTRAVEAFKSGDLNQKVELKYNNELGDLISVFNEAVEITRKTQEALTTETNRLKIVMEQVAVGIFITDAEQKIVYVNPFFEKMTGYCFADIKDRLWRKFVSENLVNDEENISEKYDISTAIQTGTAKDTHFTITQSDKKEIITKFTSSPLLDGNGKITGLVGVLGDITEEMNLANTKTNFVSTVSHELRTPLSAIAGATDILLSGMEGSITDGQKEFLTMISENTNRFARLINDLLDLSKMEAGKIKMNFTEQFMLPVINEAINSIKPLLDSKKLILQRKIPTRLSSLKFDHDRICQVLINLFSNAIKFTPENGTITVECEETPENVSVSVIDTGIGMAPEDLGKVFSKFYQVNSSETKTVGGTGLGLAICREIVEKHGGEIRVTSKVGQGSKLTFVLSKTEPAVPAEKEAYPKPGIGMKKLPGKLHKIIVIEDDKNLATIIKKYFENKGYTVLINHTGENISKEAVTQHPDVIFLDIMLPNTTGFKILEILKGNPQTADIPVIITSQSSDEFDVQEKAKKLGVNHFLTKPFHVEQMYREVKKFEAE